tara:strand:+ start:142 stop:324 length:183 start_codon:yes stop_codon:yes gene_type:complete
MKYSKLKVQCLKEVDKYYNERLKYLEKYDRVDDQRALWWEFNIDDIRDDEILFLENLNDL